MGKCLQCGAERPDDKQAMKRITRRIFDHQRQKQRVVTEEMGPFCIEKIRDDWPPCGTAYQMSCEG